MFTKLKFLFIKNNASSVDEYIASKKQGDVHLKQGRMDDALACYRHSLSLNPHYVDALIGLGYILSEREQYLPAKENLLLALSVDSKAHDAHYILGTIAAKRHDLPGAIEHFAHAIDAKPDFEFAYRDLHGALLQSGDVLQLKKVIETAISVFPNSAEFQFYLSTMLADEEQYPQAIASYRKTLSMQPDSALAHKNLAELLGKCGQPEQAIDSYQAALRFEPTLVDAQIGLGNVLETLGRVTEAVASYRSATVLKPGDAVAHQYLGNALLKLNATREALACFETVVKLDPVNPIVHLVAALSGRDTDHPPYDYVKRLFDQYADKFDSHLVKALDYRTPEELARLLQTCAEPDAQNWRVLDLGCGTGLFGVAVAPFAQQLVGVDLSRKMLEQARALDIYHRLEEADLHVMMQAEATASFDVVSATDVFIYVGKLDELLIEVRRLLRPGGYFAFSAESLEAYADAEAGRGQRRDFLLASSGRYVHSIAYLDRLAALNGFEILTVSESKIRLEKGKPLQGYLLVWRRQQ